MGCGLCVVVTVCPNGVTNPTSSNQHPSEIVSKSMKTWPRGVLGPFWVAGGAKVGSRTCPGRSAGNLKKVAYQMIF